MLAGAIPTKSHGRVGQPECTDMVEGRTLDLFFVGPGRPTRVSGALYVQNGRRGSRSRTGERAGSAANGRWSEHLVVNATSVTQR